MIPFSGSVRKATDREPPSRTPDGLEEPIATHPFSIPPLAVRVALKASL